SDSHCMEETVGGRTQKLQNMGAAVVSIADEGRRAEYTLQIPIGFWRMILIDGMSYTPIGAEYSHCIINGRDMVNTAQGAVAKFTIEPYTELATKYDAEFKAVEATCDRIRKYLREHGYISTDSSTKTHRVKISKLIGGSFYDEWALGEEAIVYDQRVRAIWHSFYQKKLDTYRKIEPLAESVPTYLIANELN